MSDPAPEPDPRLAAIRQRLEVPSRSWMHDDIPWLLARVEALEQQLGGKS